MLEGYFLDLAWLLGAPERSRTLPGALSGAPGRPCGSPGRRRGRPETLPRRTPDDLGRHGASRECPGIDVGSIWGAPEPLSGRIWIDICVDCRLLAGSIRQANDAISQKKID